jgi:hypothetical protein
MWKRKLKKKYLLASIESLTYSKNTSSKPLREHRPKAQKECRSRNSEGLFQQSLEFESVFKKAKRNFIIIFFLQQGSTNLTVCACTERVLFKC